MTVHQIIFIEHILQIYFKETKEPNNRTCVFGTEYKHYFSYHAAHSLFNNIHRLKSEELLSNDRQVEN